MKNIHEPTYSFVILTLVLIVIDTLLAWLSISLFPVILPSVPGSFGVSFPYFAVAFMILLTLWFGAYGAIAAYAGTLIGSGLISSGALANQPAVVVYLSVAGLLQVLIPLIAFRVFEVNVGMENRRDFFHMILFGVIINNIIGATWGAYTLSFGHIIQSGDVVGVFSLWLIGNMVITVLIVPVLLWRFTPVIRKSKLFVRNYWD
jgi:hypothetical protein